MYDKYSNLERKMRIRQKIKPLFMNNKFLYIFLRAYRIVRYYLFYIFLLKNEQVFHKKRYQKLQSLKNSCSGRCFIIGTGPSLTIKDLIKLKNEITFGANSLCRVFGQIGFATTYYGFQDEGVWLESKDIIRSLDLNHVFYNSRLLFELGKKNFSIYKDAIPFFNFPCRHNLDYGKDLRTKFSLECDKIVYDGYTILYSLVQIAVYMGFSEIYLLGADCNYNPIQKMHFIDSAHDADIDDPTFQNNAGGRSMIESYKIAKQFADSNGIKIFNATRGGILEVFPRVNLDEVLKSKNQGKK